MKIQAEEGSIFVYTAKGANQMRVQGHNVGLGDPVNRDGGTKKEIPFDWIKSGMVGTKKVR